MTTAQQAEITRQLGEIFRILGDQGARIEGLREDVQSSDTEAKSYRKEIYQRLENAAMRLEKLEESAKVTNSTIEKTLIPMVTTHNVNRQRLIGFISAWTLMIGLVTGLLTFNWSNIMKIIGKIGGG
jgi:hypothetical protein